MALISIESRPGSKAAVTPYRVYALFKDGYNIFDFESLPMLPDILKAAALAFEKERDLVAASLEPSAPEQQ